MMRPDSHEIYARRRSRNRGLGMVLAGVVALIFAVTVVKLQHGQSMEGFDHQFRPSMLPATEPTE
jgi:hypothetical protein